MILKILSVTLLLSITTEVTSEGELGDCYANSSKPYLKFATKTAYEFVYERPKLGDPGVPNCEPVQLWVLSRHGTRYPTPSGIRDLAQLENLKLEIIKNHEERKAGHLSSAELKSLKGWKFNVNMSDATVLTKQGFSDLHFLGKRLRTKYPALFKQGYSPILFQFKHTDTVRTKQSAQSFAEGMFGSLKEVWIPPGVVNDTVIKPYENCTYWINRVQNNPENQREAKLFTESRNMKALVHNVSLRLGFARDLSFDTISAMYDMCRFDKAWTVNESSPWCAAFIKDELKALEYWEDIKTYYDSGYGDELNLRLGCMPLKDILERFRKLESNVQNIQQPVGVFYFTHFTILLMMLARMGIASHGLPLKHDNYEKQENRDWRMSDISPFAANFEAVFYKCTKGEVNRVMFFLNERRVDYEGCDAGLCSWKYIWNKFSEIPDKCNLDWCHNK